MREDGFAARLLFNGTSNLLAGFFRPFGARFNFGLSRPRRMYARIYVREYRRETGKNK